MVGLFPKLVVSASMAAGVGLFAGAPALAASLQGASTTGDILVYCSNGTNTFLCDNSNLGTALQGDLTAPGGNVELFADSETAPGLAKFLSGTYSTLSGTLNGQAIQFRSLVKSDWTAQFTQAWLTDVATQNGISSILTGGLLSEAVGYFTSNTTEANAALARLSDPNIAFVNQDLVSGMISVGLAGHMDVTNIVSGLIATSKTLTNIQKTQYGNVIKALGTQGVKLQASELVKVLYDGQETVRYGGQGIASGQVEAGDGKSHNGTYLVQFQGKLPEPPAATPEPSLMVGLAAVGSWVALKRRQSRA